MFTIPGGKRGALSKKSFLQKKKKNPHTLHKRKAKSPVKVTPVVCDEQPDQTINSFKAGEGKSRLHQTSITFRILLLMH